MTKKEPISCVFSVVFTPLFFTYIPFLFHVRARSQDSPEKQRRTNGGESESESELGPKQKKET